MCLINVLASWKLKSKLFWAQKNIICIFFPMCLCVSVCTSVCLSHLYFCQSVCRSVCASLNCLANCLPFIISVYMSVCPGACLSVSILLSLFLCVCLCFCLSAYRYIFRLSVCYMSFFCHYIFSYICFWHAFHLSVPCLFFSLSV
jgi:hypothetical protein